MNEGMLYCRKIKMEISQICPRPVCRPRGSSASRLQLCAQTSSINIRTRRIILIDVNASSCELASNSEELLRG